PGGCAIGDRPIDLHLKGLAALGADVHIKRGCVVATAKKLQGAKISLVGPRGPTVTGTANIMAAATLARGQTTIVGAAREPEIVDVGRFLIAMGARIDGLGTSTIEIDGVEQLGGATHRVIPDRIEAATLLIAAAITRGSIEATGVISHHLEALLETLDRAGAEINRRDEQVTLSMNRRPRPLRIAADAYPGIPTDVQAQLMALLTVASGTSTIRDNVFPERFAHVNELNRLGAAIAHRSDGATISGVSSLHGTTVTASDLRASAALVLAGLAARGTTIVRRIEHLDRGYERLEEKLARLGARIERITESDGQLSHHDLPVDNSLAAA
ncbi:MAG TPA: UDP-N-acetylglucosamine 1-carboxyvinyltransferase, partial [Pirellulales bacterium]